MALLSWLRIPGSSYAVTRPITLRYFNVLFIVLGLIYLVFITLINVVAVGYESIPASSPLYLHTEKLWYENLLPHNAALPHTWNCNASVIKVNEALDTWNRLFPGYQLVYFTDSNKQPWDEGLEYRSDSFRNCSVVELDINQSLYTEVQDFLQVFCHTTANQSFLVKWASSESVDPLNGYSNPVSSTDDRTQALDINQVLVYWNSAATALWYFIVPLRNQSAFYLTLQNTSLASVQLSYSEFDHEFQPNTPANDHWEMKLSTRQIGALSNVDVYITFSSNGSLDMTRTNLTDLDRANRFLAPAIASLQTQFNSSSFDFWQLINWLYVSYYWIILADFGETAPTIYYDNGVDVASTLPSTNNIFVNPALFQSYQLYLRNTVLPLLNGTGKYNNRILPAPPFQDLSSGTLTFGNEESSFVRGYPYVVRSRKSWLSLIISVIVADYALVMSAYHVTMIVATWVQGKRRQFANYCEGCIKYNLEPKVEASTPPNEGKDI